MQKVHELAPKLVLMVPGAHGVGAVEPVAQLEPIAQGVHADASTRPLVLEKVPAKQGSSAEAPYGQKLPPRQRLHTVEPEPS